MTIRKHGPWNITSSEQVHCDAWIKLYLDQVIRPDGLPGTYTTVHLKPGVCVIAVDHQRRVHLTREFHYAVGRVTVEGVSGGIEDGELPQAAAVRELAEELGIQAARWTSLGCVDPFTSAILSPVSLFLAQDLTFCETSPEGTEQIEHVVMTLDEAIQSTRDGGITHAPTCVALLRIALDNLPQKGTDRSVAG